MTIAKIIEKTVQDALIPLGISGQIIHLEHPADVSRGDFATNVAMVCAKKVRENPQKLAEKMVQHIVRNKPSEIEKVEVAGSGFINFYLSREFFAESIQEILEKNKKWGNNKSSSGKNILIEKSAPNLFKPFHVGHLLNISIGEALSRLVRFSDAHVVDVAYPSDISLGVAQAVWAILKNGKQDELNVKVLGECYVYGHKMYEEDENAQKEITVINKKIHAGEVSGALDIYRKGKQINLDYFNNIAKRLGSTFDDSFFESDAGIVGKEIVESHVGDVFEKSEGAVVFKGERYGLHTRVFITSADLPVYEAKDIGLLKLKFEKFNPDISIVITDVEQRQYFEVVKKATQLIKKEWAEKSIYWQHGRLRLAEGRVSSRLGNVPLAEDLIDQVKELALKKMKDSGREIGESGDVAEIIALGAIKYTFLKSSTGQNIVFDFERSLSFEGDSGPYLQYAHTRAKAVLEKANERDLKEDTGNVPRDVSELERLLYRFPEVVERAAKEYEPHYVATYLTSVASTFNNFYAHERILDADKSAKGYLLALTHAFQITMHNGLWLLGIETPAQM